MSNSLTRIIAFKKNSKNSKIQKSQKKNEKQKRFDHGEIVFSPIRFEIENYWGIPLLNQTQK